MKLALCAVLTLALCGFACSPAPRSPSSASHSARFVSTPSSIALLSANHETVALPAEIRFGGPLGRGALYLKFTNHWPSTPQRAFIALSPREGASLADAVTIEAWRINATWEPSTLHGWSDKPELAPPYARAEVSVPPSGDVRIDVTELIRFAAANPERDFGIALLATGNSDHGATFDTGMNGGHAPRLEVYTR